MSDRLKNIIEVVERAAEVPVREVYDHGQRLTREDAMAPDDLTHYMRACSEYRDRIATLEAQVAALVDALEQVRETAEHSRRAESKGSAPYTVEFFVACLDKMDTALASSADAAKAYMERIRADEREACAKVAEAGGCGPTDAWRTTDTSWIAGRIAATIRARGKS